LRFQVLVTLTLIDNQRQTAQRASTGDVIRLCWICPSGMFESLSHTSCATLVCDVIRPEYLQDQRRQ